MEEEVDEPNNSELREQVGRLQSAQAVDPTSNVLEHVRLHSLRQDDLRKAEGEYVRREMELRAEHARLLAAAEKERLDAIRAIDAQSINLASSTVASVQSAMDDRINQVAERAQQQLAATTTLLQERLLAIERNQYTGLGAKSQGLESRQQQTAATGIFVAVVGAVLSSLLAIVAIIVVIVIALSQ